MPALYEHHGIRFAYPDNWQLVGAESDEGIETDLVDVTLQTPGGGFWSIQVLPAGCSPAECVEQVIKGLKSEYDDLELESKSIEMGDVLLAGYELRFFCLDMLVEARVWACRRPGATLVIHWQEEQQEFAKLEPVFQAITTSLFLEEIGN